MKDFEARAEDIFQKATTLPSDEARDAYVMGACEGDDILGQRVKQLLEAYSEAGEMEFLKTVERPVEPRDTLQCLTLSEGPGTVIGRYKLLQQIGEGGFGVVYMAEQKEPVKRRVALKIIKLGMDTKQVVARFEAERQALALMEHPNIARVLDAGATETGRPYFVMELVKGIPITQFCDENNLTFRERLSLFISVCRATQHAHQKGIIHRDLKPSNVLVTLHDDQPVPKIIDFGIAKATQQELTTKTLFTQFQQFIGTPAYMSPEQAQLSGLDIDTRSDVYALGVLLYELLTGQTPFDTAQLLSGGYDEIRRRIREEDPPKPSTRWSTLQAEQRRVVARSRNAEPEKLGTFLRGDLDWIVMKALEKDRTHRYETANSLAHDIERHLANEPVSAAAPSATYRLRKFARRNRGPLTVAAVILGLLLTGTLVVGWQAARAIREAERARKAHQLAIEQRDLAQASEAKAAVSRAEAEHQRSKTEQALGNLQIQRAEMLLAAGQSEWALAQLARILRERPDHQVAANRLISALVDRTYPIQLYGPMEHEDPVQFAEFSADGQKIVTASWDQSARLWNATDGRPVGDPMRHENRVWLARFSPDSQRVVTASEDGTARIWDANTGRPLSEPMRHEGNVYGAEFSPDGTQVLTAASDMRARIWNSKTGQLVLESLQHEDILGHAHFNSDGTRIVTACNDKTVRVWDAQTGVLIGEPIRHEADIRSAFFSPDGSKIVSAAGDRTVRVWDTQTGKPLTHPLKHAHPVRNAVFSEDGLKLLTVTYKTVEIWDATLGQRLQLFADHDGLYVYGARLSPEGQRIAINSGNTARVWDVATGEPLTEPCRHQNYVRTADFSPDGRTLLTASWDKSARVWDIQNGRALSHKLAHTNDVMDLDFSPDGRWLVTASSDHTARVWNALTGQAVTPPLRHEGEVAAVQFSPDGSRVASAGWDDQARVWDVETGRQLFESIRHQGGIPTVRFSPDGRSIVTASIDHSARVWDSDDGQPITPPLQHDERVFSAEFSPDGRYVVTASWDKTARIWDARTGEQIGSPLSHEDWVSTASFSPESQRVVTACARKIQVWDVETGKPLTDPLPHQGHVKSVRFSPDGLTIASASFDSTILIWDAATGEIKTEPLRHSERAVYARFSKSGDQLATCSMDGTARLWDTGTGLPLTEPFRHSDGVERVQLSPSGRSIATASYDDTARIWSVPAISGPVPTWFPEWAETLVGRRVTPEGIIQELPPNADLEFRQRIMESADTDAATKIAQWFFSDRSNRAISPIDETTVVDYVDQLVEENTLESLRAALLLSPPNAEACLHLAVLLAAQDSKAHPGKDAEAGFYRHLAAKRQAKGAQDQ